MPRAGTHSFGEHRRPSNLADFLGANLNLDVQQKQDLLEELDVTKRTHRVLHHVSYQLEISKLQQKIQADVQTSITDVQRKIFLREQMKAIQKELGEHEDASTKTIAQLKEKIGKAKLPEKVDSEAQRELGRLETIHPASPEYSLILTYLQLLADLPWNHASTDNLDLQRARRILSRDHFGLEKVKRR
ncbi:MAG: endopeptidase La, partial [Phycisphaerales bacterium]|nr:endopeptidase La [Phycisphaerales bacterium]